MHSLPHFFFFPFAFSFAADLVDAVSAKAKPVGSFRYGIMSRLARKASQWRRAAQTFGFNVGKPFVTCQDHPVHIRDASSGAEDTVAYGVRRVSNELQSSSDHLRL